MILSLTGLHLDLDGAWDRNVLPIETRDLTSWGPKLRFSAPESLIDRFYDEIYSELPPFLLYGSGDFHHLAALWIRRLKEPVVVVSLDNHPDWAVTPPKWACGAWVNRALELDQVKRVSVWGCGNFECWWPLQILGNRRAERNGRLEVHPWADGRPAKDQRRRGAILQDNWRDHFQEFVQKLGGALVYVTIDLDCLALEEAVTNWENGRFRAADVAWALKTIREISPIIAGDMCGAFSPPVYARWRQRFAARMDHPKLPQTSVAQGRQTNLATLQKLWPVLSGEP